MPLRQKRTMHPVGRRTPPVEQLRGCQQEGAHTHRANPAACASVVANPSNERLITRHVVHRAGTWHDQCVDHLPFKRAHRLGTERQTVRCSNGTAADGAHTTLVEWRFAGYWAESICNDERLKRSSEVK